MHRRAYDIELVINDRLLKKVVIDPHYEEKHGDSVNDETILALVQMLDRRSFEAEAVDDDGFQYFVEDRIEFESRLYKLIWLLHDEKIFIGVVNCYRRD